MSERLPDPPPPPGANLNAPPPGSSIVEHAAQAEQALATADAQAGDVIPFSIVEEFYKRPGRDDVRPSVWRRSA